MTQDKARKIATRQRMAETGEPYSVARHAVQDEHDSPEDLAGAPHDDPAGEPGTGADESRAAEQLADEAEQAVDQAEEAADEAEELAGEWAGGSSDRPRRSRGRYRTRRPSLAPWPSRPPRPPRPHHGRPGPDWDPADRPQDRIEQMLQRFSLVRDRADELISQAERIFGAGRAESKRVDPTSPEA